MPLGAVAILSISVSVSVNTLGETENKLKQET